MSRRPVVCAVGNIDERECKTGVKPFGAPEVGKTLYLECASGISGDMAVAALLDLGASEQRLREALASLPVQGFETRISRVSKSGLDACDFAVVLDAEHENHDHDMRYLHGDLHGDEGGAPYALENGHVHDQGGYVHDQGGHAYNQNEHVHNQNEHHCDLWHHHPRETCCDSYHHHHHHHHHQQQQQHQHQHHSHEHCCNFHHHHSHEHPYEHRGMPEIEAIINSASITARAKGLALKIFSIIAAAEAKAHGTPVDQVYFHEVGALDSIVDVVAFSVCFDDLDVDEVVVEGLCEGCGTVRCQHGLLPVPTPAVLNIVSQADIPLSIMDVQGEFVTPTGAAIAAAVRTRSALPLHFKVRRVGLGAGKREYALPSFLRAMIVEEAKESADSLRRTSAALSGGALSEIPIWRLECEVDDCTGEALGFVLDRLFAVGAREAHFVPVFMKKNRPAYQIQIICTEDMIPVMEAELFAHTTTIGIRRTPMDRTALSREAVQVETPLGSVRAKKVTLPGGKQRIYPEHDDVVVLCELSKGQVAYQEAYRLVLSAIENTIESES